MQITLKAARVNKGLKQKEAAKKLGVTTKTLASWESFKTMPNADKIILICEHYGVCYDDIKWKAS